jgi:lysophospholipase L1-like esterase
MVQNNGLAPTHVVWMQGESDTSSRTTQASYTASLQTVIDNIRGSGITAPILVNVESWLNGATYAPVRNAQMSVAGSNGVIQGADVDSLNNSYRYDGTHLNATGATAVANMLADIIANNP